MKLALVAPGYKPFPPQGWGAVESIVWDYYENLTKRNVNVHIINSSQPAQIIQECNTGNFDIIHIMYDDHIIVAPYLQCRRILYTTHYAYITHPEFEKVANSYFSLFFKAALHYQSRIQLHAISDPIKEVYRKYGFGSTIRVVHNGAREDLFRYTEVPRHGDQSVYVAKIEYRKGQYKYQTIPSIRFVGNYHDSPFDVSQPTYLGEWDKPTLYENLTDYGNLLLLSNGEADPLVVKEALIAGLGVVVSECATANLDCTLPFITVIPDDKLSDIEYVETVLCTNREYSIAHRKEIREYALSKFAWGTIIDNYMSILSSMMK